MRFALVNPNWTFKGSVYFGCREPHLPIELGYAKELLTHHGHEAVIIDAHAEHLSYDALYRLVSHYQPDFTVISTAPTYLFWRCPPPELRVPQETIQALKSAGGMLIAIGPHGSTTPAAAIKKLGADAVVMGEAEEILPLFVTKEKKRWHSIPSICFYDRNNIVIQSSPHAADVKMLPAIRWGKRLLHAHHHHHHRFDEPFSGLGAEIEASRGCPFQCSFCAKDTYRNRYRKRPLSTVTRELLSLVQSGVSYVYFIDEVFLPQHDLMKVLARMKIKFGIQTRIDLWNRDDIDMLGEAGCVSVEAGIESVSEQGRSLLNKRYSITNDQITELLIYAKQKVPFVQATLIGTAADTRDAVENWRQYLLHFGVWVNKPVPLFPYPGSQEYSKRWGKPDEKAWERAHDYYMQTFSSFSDIQESSVLRLPALEERAIHGQRLRITN